MKIKKIIMDCKRGVPGVRRMEKGIELWNEEMSVDRTKV